jgi:cell wall-associated NlpC family hydrolase
MQTPAQEVYGVVDADILNIRDFASTDANVVGTVHFGDVVDVLGQQNDWIELEKDGVKGYASADFVNLGNGTKPVPAPTGRASEVIAYAKQFLGTPYVYGGTSLTSGVDCSGFVEQVMKHFGVNLQRSSAQMAAGIGTPISKDQIQTGDLLFFAEDGVHVSHVGIYIGDGTYIHSTDAKMQGVALASLYTDYAKRTYHSAKRVL